ncbi:hypothetical protein ACQP1O_42980 (plasmid) [Nocardia sp. CA-151230]|uniref:hypothetical protein n=1 Tax=Nocardia sp. CA-151230 TaxID=3239982 RepID=UPI003D8F9026
MEAQDAEGNWKWQPSIEVFDYRSYNLFGWLGDVRNYSVTPPLASERGVPDDATDEVRDALERWDCDAHSESWVGVDELLAFDYEASFEDRRVTVGTNGGRTAEPGDGTMTTYREFLGTDYFSDLDKLTILATHGPTRVVFWFDN